MKVRRAHLIVLACMALPGAWLLWPEAPRPVHGLVQVRYAKASIPPAGRGDAAFAMAAPATPAMANDKAPAPVDTRTTPTPPPFAFLGQVTEEGESVVLLYRAGRTLKVRSPGRVADDYEVHLLTDNLLVLRHLPTATQQVIELAARDAHPLSGDPEDSPRD